MAFFLLNSIILIFFFFFIQQLHADLSYNYFLLWNLVFHIFGKKPVYSEQPWQLRFVFNTLTLLTDLRITARASAQAAHCSPRESLTVADDEAPAWRALSEVLVKVVSPNSWLESHNCSISHPLLDPPADTMLLLIKATFISIHLNSFSVCFCCLFSMIC